MSTSIQKFRFATLLTFGGLLLGNAASAFATPQMCPYTPPEKWLPMAQIEQIARNMGYQEFFVQPEGGCWAIITHNAQGMQWQILLFPNTGEIFRQGRT